MGYLFLFITNNNNNINLNNKIINNVMNMKNRGPNQSLINTISNVDISKPFNTSNGRIFPNSNFIKKNLTKTEILNYKIYNFTYGFHRNAITDNTPEGNQPFNNSSTSSDNENIVLGIGEIYNYNNVKTQYNLTTNSESDIEVFSQLYSTKFQNLNSENRFVECLKTLKGDYSILLLNNINTYKLSNINCYISSDFLGITKIYIAKNKDTYCYFFSNELKAFPDYVLEKNKTWEIKLLPAGCYWKFNPLENYTENIESLIFKWSDFDFDNYTYDNILYKTYSSSNTENIFINLKQNLINSIKNRIHDNIFGFLLDGEFSSMLILTITIDYLVQENLYELIEKIQLFNITSNCIKSIKICSCINNFITYLNNKYNINLFVNYIYLTPEIITNKTIIKNLEYLVYTTETFNTDSIVKSFVFFYLYKFISEKFKINTNKLKVLFSGLGFNNNLIQNNQNNEDLQNLIIQKYKQNFINDKLYSDFSFEIRFPYFDQDVIDILLNTSPVYKIPYKWNNNTINMYYLKNCFSEFIPLEFIKSFNEFEENNIFSFIENKINNFFNIYYTDNDFDNYILKNKQRQKKYPIPTSKTDMGLQIIYNSYFKNPTN